MAESHLVTAEEARALLKSATPGSMRAADDGSGCGPDCCKTWVVRDNVGVRLALLDADGEADARLFAAAPSLAHTVIALEAERDELRLTLLNERGEGAPPSEGWAWGDDGGKCSQHEWIKAGPRLDSAVWRGPCNIEPYWYWQAHPIGGSRQGSEPTAREAMKAADIATKEPR